MPRLLQRPIAVQTCTAATAGDLRFAPAHHDQLKLQGVLRASAGHEDLAVAPKMPALKCHECLQRLRQLELG